MPRLGGLSEGSTPTQDASKATAEPISLDAFLKVFKGSIEKQDKRFQNLEQSFEKQYQRYKEPRSNRQMEGLPGQQAGPGDEEAYSEESGELEDDSTADGEVTVTPS